MTTTNHPVPTPPPAEPAPSLRPVEELHRLVEEIVMAPGWREALRAAVAAADRENAELRGQLRESDSRFRTAAELLGERTSQLAAAQAQLAEARAANGLLRTQVSALDRVYVRTQNERNDAQARLRAVNDEATYDDVYTELSLALGTDDTADEDVDFKRDLTARIISHFDAALSAAPQPEPARCADKCPSLVGGPAFCCVLTAGHIGWHEAETEGNGYPPMHWLTPDDADGPR